MPPTKISRGFLCELNRASERATSWVELPINKNEIQDFPDGESAYLERHQAERYDQRIPVRRVKPGRDRSSESSHLHLELEFHHTGFARKPSSCRLAKTAQSQNSLPGGREESTRFFGVKYRTPKHATTVNTKSLISSRSLKFVFKKVTGMLPLVFAHSTQSTVRQNRRCRAVAFISPYLVKNKRRTT